MGHDARCDPVMGSLDLTLPRSYSKVYGLAAGSSIFIALSKPSVLAIARMRDPARISEQFARH